MLLADKVTVVNGGTRGVGAAVARAAAREGGRVTVTGRRVVEGEALAAELTGLARSPGSTVTGGGTEAAFVRADLADPAQARAGVDHAVAAHGRVDCLVNAAGLTSRGTLLETSPELFEAHMAINLRAPFFAMQAAVADMVARKAAGTVLNIGSNCAHGGPPHLAPYSAAKAGLAGLTRNAAHAHRWDRVRINGLDIGWTDTEGEDEIQRRFHGAGDGWQAEAARGQPMGRLGQVDEIADFAVFLLSERSGVVTGSVIDWDQQVVGAFD